MEISYKRKYSDSYMIIEGTVPTNSMEERMMAENNILAIMDFSSIQIDGKTQIWYNISKLESLRDYLENEELSHDLILKILIHLKLNLEETGRYLINPNHFLINLDAVYVDRKVDGLSMKLCYYPDESLDVKNQIKGIFEEILSLVPDGRSAISEMIYGLYDLTQKGEFTIDELIEYINETNIREYPLPDVSPVIEEQNVVVEREIKVEEIVLDDEDDYISNCYEADAEEVSLWTQITSKIFRPFKSKKNDVEENYYKEDFIIEPTTDLTEATVLISKEDIKCTGKLMYDGTKNGQNFLIDRDIFKIGSADNNHGSILSKAVSRHHAKIVREDEDYYLEDLNSTNGTYLNGHLLSYKNKVKLKPMDNIRFADESYIFM